MAPMVYLITGANRGIGLAMTTQLSARADTVVFAGVRNPASAQDLQAVAVRHPRKVHLVKLASGDKAETEGAIAKVKEVVGRLDVVIANAGICTSFVPSLEVSIEDMREHFEVNVLGPMVLFQAAYALLRASENPKFIVISSGAGSIEVGARLALPELPYGVSKAGVNFMAAQLYHEYPPIVVLPIHPGLVKTDMAVRATTELSEHELARMPMITVEQSASDVLKIVDGAKRDESGPKFYNHDGSVLPW